MRFSGTIVEYCEVILAFQAFGGNRLVTKRKCSCSFFLRISNLVIFFLKKSIEEDFITCLI
jgi:hypothetical protein